MEMFCRNCRFFKRGSCRRYAPQPYNFIIYHALELIRDIAWSLREQSNIEEASSSDVTGTDATEASSYAIWPDVDEMDWCGEWEANNLKDHSYIVVPENTKVIYPSGVVR